MPRFDQDRERFVSRIDRRRRWAHRRYWLECKVRQPAKGIQATVYDASFRSDAEAVAYFYAIANDHMPDFVEPIWINEKIRWQFLRHRNPLMSLAADKIAVRDYVKWKGSEIEPPQLIATGSTPADLEAVEFPEQFVMKSTYGSGQHYVQDGWYGPDRERLLAVLEAWNNWDQWRRTGELHYRSVPKRWLIEELITAQRETLEFKFACMHGEPVYVTVIGARNGTRYQRAVYDLDWRRLDLVAEGGGAVEMGPVARPAEFDRMLTEARRLSEDFMHVRVDFLKFDDRLVFSELTFASLAACHPFRPIEYNRELGTLINLDRAGEYLSRGRRIAGQLGWKAAAA